MHDHAWVVGPVHPMSASKVPAVDAMLAGLVGLRVSGGCDRCDAEQTMAQELPGIYRLTVRHERRCPVLRAMRRRR